VKRNEFSSTTKDETYERQRGLCAECGVRLAPGNCFFDHIIPNELGGPNTPDNCQALCRSHHGSKTSSRDVPAIAKSRRSRRRHLGIKKRSRFRGWRRNEIDAARKQIVYDLSAVAEVIRRQGWCQGMLGCYGGPVCIQGAMYQVLPQDDEIKLTIRMHYLARTLGFETIGDMTAWNDEADRTVSDVLQRIKGAVRAVKQPPRVP
jgi:hypothetical protein